MINFSEFFWRLFCAMDLEITIKKRVMEEGPYEEFNNLEYENLCTLHTILEEEWNRMDEELEGVY